MLRWLKAGFMVLFMGVSVQAVYAGNNDEVNERRLPPRLSYITQVEVNDMSVRDEVPISQISAIFKQTYAFSGMQYQGATGDMHIWFQSKNSSLSFLTDLSELPPQTLEVIHDEFQRGEKSQRWEALLKQNGGKWLMQSNLLGAWDIRWLSMDNFQDKLKLDGVIISPKMTLSEFAKMFPVSMRSASYYQEYTEKEFGKEVYYVTIDPMIDGDLPYWDHLKFVFVGEKLVEIALERGVRY